MKKLLTLLSCALAIGISAQTHRFIYEYKFVPNLKEKDSVKKELMALDITEKGSVYQSYDRLKADSTMKVEINEMMKTGNFQRGNRNIAIGGRGMNMGQVREKVTKEYPSFKTYLQSNLGGDAYKVVEDKKPEWNISSEKQKIGEYTAQKATTTFGGRDWEVWFSTDIPFQDGPYKFQGLPGLIVKAVDKTGTHDITLVANKTLPKVEEKEDGAPNPRVRFSMGRNEIEINNEQYKKAFKNYINDPAKSMREMQSRMRSSDGSSRTMFRMRDQNGKELSPDEMIRSMEKRVKEDQEKNNNPIEPTLYK